MRSGIENEDLFSRSEIPHAPKTSSTKDITKKSSGATRDIIAKPGLKNTTSFDHSGRRTLSQPSKKSLEGGKRASKKTLSEFATAKKYKKGDMFVIDEQEESDDSDDGGNLLQQLDDQVDGSPSYVIMDENAERKGVISHDNDVLVQDEDMLDRKASISQGDADELVLDEDNNSPAGVAQTASVQSMMPQAESDAVISDTMLDGLNKAFETDQMIRANQLKGKVFPAPIRSQPAVITQFAKQKDLSTLLKSGMIESPDDLNTVTSQVTSPEVTSQTQSPFQSILMPHTLAPVGSTSNSNATVGDFAAIVEQASNARPQNPGIQVEQASNAQAQNVGLQQGDAISRFRSHEKNLLESVANSLTEESLSAAAQQTATYGQHPSDFDVQPNVDSLSKSEQQLITNLDNAARKKDAAASTATQIMLPTKEEASTDRTIAPPEQLLEMLSKGKFENPLPENVLNTLSTYDPNKAYLRSEGFPALNKVANNGKVKFVKVGPDYFPVRSVGINMPKPTASSAPQASSAQVVSANTRMVLTPQKVYKSSPHLLDQNMQMLDPSKFNTVDDLQRIGSPVLPGNIVEYHPPVQPPAQPPPMPHVVMKPVLKAPPVVKLAPPAAVAALQHAPVIHQPVKVFSPRPAKIYSPQLPEGGPILNNQGLPVRLVNHMLPMVTTPRITPIIHKNRTFEPLPTFEDGIIEDEGAGIITLQFLRPSI